MIYRVQGIDVKKEPITMKTRGSRKEDPIQELWLELEKLIVSMSGNYRCIAKQLKKVDHRNINF